MASSFVPDTAGLHRLIHDPTSQVGRYLERTAERVVVEAEGLAPVGDGRAGHLFAAIDRTTPAPTAEGQMVRVRARKPYAAAVILGARPHIIVPKRARALRFESHGTVVITQRVHHPGNKARNFLMTAARRIIHGAT